MLGVAGAVREPFIGFRSGGFAGMTTGLFTGWVGLVLRPTYGTLMSTSQVSIHPMQLFFFFLSSSGLVKMYLKFITFYNFCALCGLLSHFCLPKQRCCRNLRRPWHCSGDPLKMRCSLLGVCGMSCVSWSVAAWPLSAL